jgi:hypothetical protein
MHCENQPAPEALAGKVDELLSSYFPQAAAAAGRYAIT